MKPFRLVVKSFFQAKRKQEIKEKQKHILSHCDSWFQSDIFTTWSNKETL